MKLVGMTWCALSSIIYQPACSEILFNSRNLLVKLTGSIKTFHNKHHRTFLNFLCVSTLHGLLGMR